MGRAAIGESVMTKRKTSFSTRGATDYGSPELAQRFTVVPKLTASNGFHGKVADDTEIDSLLLHDVISALEHSLLMALLQRLHKAMFIGIKSPDLNGVAYSDPSRLADRKANAVMSVCGLISRMDIAMGRVCRSALIDLVIGDVPWPSHLNLHRATLALQDCLADRQRKLTGQETGQHEVPVGMHAYP
jgi:hypothetical protein